jgi:uncharacterized protein (DUF849 family)
LVTWIEVALNGPWGAAMQPGIPVSHEAIVREAIACAEAGAAIVHFHAYDESTGRQNDDWQSYARTIAAIRDAVDVIAYPTVPLSGDAVERYHHIDELGRRGLIEWAVVDPGSLDVVMPASDGAIDPGFVYMNLPDHVREGLSVCRDYGIRPSYAIYEPGFTRLGAMLAAEYPGLPRSSIASCSAISSHGDSRRKRTRSTRTCGCSARAIPRRPGWSRGSASRSSRWPPKRSRAADMYASASRTPASASGGPTSSW